ncbi:MAG TPA: HD domain-containing protein [Spirochaetales bacterium]|nr:HD domain-containing protein [Spirochaetales bacterium]
MREGALHAALEADFTEPVRDPLWGNIFLSPGLEAVAASPAFAKLGRIRQLGPAQLVYPGATHSRRAHSLGVFHTAKRLVAALARREGLDFVTREGLLSFLLAALCHDLGHFPFAHSLKELPLEPHEALTARLLRAEPLRGLAGRAGADPELAAAIVDESLPGSGGRELPFFRGLLSGVLDPDKLDYLSRDAFQCGVPYGVQDIDFVLQRVALGPGDRLGVDERGIMAVEGILFSKYLMYRSVYWHRGVRAATAMVKKAVLLAVEAGELALEELYGLDDESFFSRIRSLGPRARASAALAEAVFEGRLYGAVLDLPFDPAEPRHAALLDLGSRLGLEAAIAEAAGAGLGPAGIIVDLPEPISFETELPVLLGEGGGGGSASFSESPTVFKPPVVAGFAASLRRIRVFAAEAWPAVEAAARKALGAA